MLAGTNSEFFLSVALSFSARHVNGEIGSRLLFSLELLETMFWFLLQSLQAKVSHKPGSDILIKYLEGSLRKRVKRGKRVIRRGKFRVKV